MQDLVELTEKYINRTLTEKERERLKKLMLQKKGNRTLFKEQLVSYSQNQLFHDFDSMKAFEDFEPILDAPKSTLHKTKKWLPYAAAVAVAFLILSNVLFPGKNPLSPEKQMVGSLPSNPDGDNIVLTLADGSQKILDGYESSTVVEGNGSPIFKTTSSGLDYTPVANTQAYGYHKIYVPNGQKFNITLADGTKIWLNSGSTLTFPPRFNTALDHRMVHLKGEAYFDVAGNKDFPFIVNVNDLNIKVLGTEFNVCAYEEHKQVSTTLIEGAVSLYDGNTSGKKVILRPDQQGSFDKFNKSFTKKQVDVGLFTAWMQNKMVFSDMPMHRILQNIERTYNVNITNENTTIANERFTGEFDVEDIETIFKVLSTSIHFEYEIHHHQITIKK
ncbi:DUF4974 domain-containing protein [Muricauda sp. SCSIO 64092]|uniref:FecR family protein n=1 Tax=Allomuricauda sp. SCSIO 64092 TaxID=2908842 RepID=UPI001FF236F6|nr:FecR domain-containing protein [Muricauda sp. SCSIO 64092]UOY08331.1 DUF4974 domain-containing protein [Muricauda sp. SCSIO 64092]